MSHSGTHSSPVLALTLILPSCYKHRAVAIRCCREYQYLAMLRPQAPPSVTVASSISAAVIFCFWVVVDSSGDVPYCFLYAVPLRHVSATTCPSLPGVCHFPVNFTPESDCTSREGKVGIHHFFGVAGLFGGVSANPTLFFGEAVGVDDAMSYSYHTPLIFRLSFLGGGVMRLPMMPNGTGEDMVLEVSDIAGATFICDIVDARLSMPLIMPSQVFANCAWFLDKLCICVAVVFITVLICSCELNELFERAM
jgi:hypothetical protein